MEPGTSVASSKSLLVGIAVVLLAYVLAAVCQLPQKATVQIAAAENQPHVAAEGPGAAGPARPAAVSRRPPVWMIAPFVLLLGAIAVFPLIPATSHWWESNLNRFKVAAGLAVLTVVYYLVAADFPIEGEWPAAHPSPPAASGLNYQLTGDVLGNALLAEYLPFITLLFSLYTISGGIRIQGDLRARPLTNTAFLTVGAVLASLIGTTGAAMLLIRPLLETNRERKYVKHTVIFLIFIVCNCGGCLTPLGDPPLFLGYLKKVPFEYPLGLWKEWLFVNGLLLVIYYLWDRFWCYPREKPADIRRDETRVRALKILGLWPNAVLLLGVILSVAFLDPRMALTLGQTVWHPWMYLREAVQLALVALSLWLGSETIRRHNRFNYHAIVEVAVLFFGIFLCMQPPLQILGVEGGRLGLTEPWHYFWATGSLSSVLDNAPTYVVFFETAREVTKELGLTPAVAGVHEELLAAVSLGAVFMGANTYIGNGPNFMVRAIAESSGVRMPSFFGYLLYSGLILLPLFALVTVVFLR